MTSRYNAKNVEVKKYEKDYSEEGFWKKIKRHGIKIGAKPIYLSLLLFYSLPKVSILDKAIIIGSLGYFISPIDLIPDTIPVIGYFDDVSILMLAFYRIHSNIDDETKNKVNEVIYECIGNRTGEDQLREDEVVLQNIGLNNPNESNHENIDTNNDFVKNSNFDKMISNTDLRL